MYFNLMLKSSNDRPTTLLCFVCLSLICKKDEFREIQEAVSFSGRLNLSEGSSACGSYFYKQLTWGLLRSTLNILSLDGLLEKNC